MKMQTRTEYFRNRFLEKVNKLTLGKSTSDEVYGKVKLIKSADYSRGWCERLGRFGYGTRRFSVNDSCCIPNGAYTLGGLRKALCEAGV